MHAPGLTLATLPLAPAPPQRAVHRREGRGQERLAPALQGLCLPPRHVSREASWVLPRAAAVPIPQPGGMQAEPGFRGPAV